MPRHGARADRGDRARQAAVADGRRDRAALRVVRRHRRPAFGQRARRRGAAGGRGPGARARPPVRYAAASGPRNGPEAGRGEGPEAEQPRGEETRSGQGAGTGRGVAVQPGAADAADARPRREMTDLPFGRRGAPVPPPREPVRARLSGAALPAPAASRVGASNGLGGTNTTPPGDGAAQRTRTNMAGPLAGFLRKIRYRRRWRALAAAARSAADEATAALDRRLRDWNRRPILGERPAAERQAAERVPPRPGG